MKFKFLITALLITSATFGQGRPERQTLLPKANKEFVTPFAFYATDTTKAYKIGVFGVVDNVVDAVMIKYALFTANGSMLKGSEGAYVCTGACYTSYDANDNNSPFAVLVDSVIHREIR